MSDDRCGNCLNYRNGSCHDAPPVRLPRKFDKSATAGNRIREEALIWGWPAVDYNDWCGHWSPKTSEAQRG